MAMSQMKVIIDDLNSKEIKYNRNTRICAFLLANKNEEFAYADTVCQSIFKNEARNILRQQEPSPLIKNLEVHALLLI